VTLHDLVQVWNYLIFALIVSALFLFFFDVRTECLPNEYFEKHLTKSTNTTIDYSGLPDRRDQGIRVSEPASFLPLD
jgi:hypothetical protein